MSIKISNGSSREMNNGLLGSYKFRSINQVSCGGPFFVHIFPSRRISVSRLLPP